MDAKRKHKVLLPKRVKLSNPWLMTFIYNTNAITGGLDLLICVWGGIHVWVCVYACSCVRGAPRSVLCRHSLLYILKQNLLLNLEPAVPASMLQALPRGPCLPSGTTAELPLPSSLCVGPGGSEVPSSYSHRKWLHPPSHSHSPAHCLSGSGVAPSLEHISTSRSQYSGWWD